MREPRFPTFGPWILWMILLLAIVLRVTYLAKTPYSVREHDVAAHIDYISYMAEHRRVPPAADGWEYHQPPLYYAASAVIWKTGAAVGWERDTQLFAVQIFSVFLSLAFVAIAAWIGRMIFGRKRMAEWAAFVLLIAIFPGLLIAGSRISNDSLAMVLSALAVALLLRWYRDGKTRDWYLLGIALSLAFLAKVAAVLLLPVALGLYAWKHRAQWKHHIAPLAVFVLIVAALTAWYPAVRLHEQSARAAIPGTEGLDPGVLLPTTPVNFLTFNPVKIVQIPYLDPWDDASRRQYFWEYWFRSAFLGEWNFGDALLPWSRAVLVGGLGMLFCAIVGLWQALRHGRNAEWWVLPVVAVAVVLLAGAVGYRFVNTCACAQDFRYSFPVVIPWALFAALGARYLRVAGGTWLLTCTAFVGVFYFLLPYAR